MTWPAGDQAARQLAAAYHRHGCVFAHKVASSSCRFIGPHLRTARAVLEDLRIGDVAAEHAGPPPPPDIRPTIAPRPPRDREVSEPGPVYLRVAGLWHLEGPDVVRARCGIAIGFEAVSAKHPRGTVCQACREQAA